MTTVAAEISEEYQLVIPQEVRQVLNLQPRATLLFLIEGDCVIIRPKPVSFTQTLRGLHQTVWADVDVDAWVAAERAAWA